MPLGGALIGIGSAVSGGLGFLGSMFGSSAQSKAAAEALAFQKQVYAQNQANLNPFIQTGQQADASLAALYGLGSGGGGRPDFSAFYNSPDYQWAYDQGLKATTNLLSARGNLLSGAGLDALTKYGQGMASQQFGNYYNRLLQLSQQGAGAAGALAGNATTQAGQIGNTQMGLGQAQASGIIGGTNALTGAIGGGINNYLLFNALNRINPSSYAVNTPPGASPTWDTSGAMWG